MSELDTTQTEAEIAASFLRVIEESVRALIALGVDHETIEAAIEKAGL